jgi:periplasmic protein TonB
VSASLQLNRSAVPPLHEGRAPVRERLMAMLFLTALLHAIVILGLTFASPSHPGGGESPQLDVMLVTDDVAEAQSNEHAAYLAQRTQLGSGNTDSAAAPGSPASRGAPDQPQDAPEQSATTELLSSSAPGDDARSASSTPPVVTAAAEPLPQFIGELPGDPRSGRGDAVELMLRGKSHSERWITPDTRASALAPYLASWKRKVERVGTLNFPTAARNARLSGSPVVEVEIAASGHLRQIRVRRSSGQGALDEAALTILRLASPFDPFPAALASSFARLRFAYQWDFVAGTLQSGAVTVSSDTSGGP